MSSPHMCITICNCVHERPAAPAMNWNAALLCVSAWPKAIVCIRAVATDAQAPQQGQMLQWFCFSHMLGDTPMCAHPPFTTQSSFLSFCIGYEEEEEDYGYPSHMRQASLELNVTEVASPRGSSGKRSCPTPKFGPPIDMPHLTGMHKIDCSGGTRLFLLVPSSS